MGAELIAVRIEFAAALAVLAVGAIMALASANAVKRIAGAGVALIGAMLAAAALGAPSAALSAGAAVLFATLALGAAISVRLQEGYGGVETGELNRADADDEPVEPDA